MPEAILVRTDHYNAELDRLVRRLREESNRQVVILADPKHGLRGFPDDVRVIPVRPSDFDVLVTPDCLWRCGDYALYAGLKALPEIDHFWLIEPDVRIHSDDLGLFFNGQVALPKPAQADFLTAWLTVSSPEWMWYPMMAPFASKIFNCMLQLARFSRSAVELLLRRRQEMGRRFRSEGGVLASWPNDEAFIGASITQAGLTTMTLKQYAPQFFTGGTFTFTKPVSLRWLESQPPDSHIYHPVVYGEKYVKRIVDYLHERSRAAPAAQLIREFDAGVVEQARLEGGEPGARKVSEAIETAVRDAR